MTDLLSIVILFLALKINDDNNNNNNNDNNNNDDNNKENVIYKFRKKKSPFTDGNNI